MERFIRDMCSTRVDPFLKWNEWAEYVIKMRLHPRNTFLLQLVDTKLLALINSPQGWGVEMYDLSKLGQKDIQIQQVDEGQDAGCRKLLSTPKCFAKFQLEGFPDAVYFVGNRLVCFYSRETTSGDDYFLEIWTIG